MRVCEGFSTRLYEGIGLRGEAPLGGLQERGECYKGFRKLGKGRNRKTRSDINSRASLGALET